MKKTGRIWVRIDPHQEAKLRHFAEISGLSLSAVVRRLIDQAEPADLVPEGLRQAGAQGRDNAKQSVHPHACGES